MTTTTQCFALRPLCAAVQGALLGLALMGGAHAADVDPAVAALTTPTSSVEVGLQNTNQGNYKFGEYNGLRDKGVDSIFNLDLRGGGAYDSNDATRWRLYGKDLGLDNRSAGMEYGEQGRYRVTFGYDELFRARSDSYQTPYGGIGTGNLTLSNNWPIPVYVPGPTNGVAQAKSYANAKNLSAAELGDFRVVDLYTDRKKGSLGVSFESGTHWEFKLSAISEEKDGLKPTGGILTMSGLASGDKTAILPEPIHFKTYQYEANASYTGEQTFFKAGVYTSFFRNAVNGLTFADAYEQPGAGGQPSTVLGAGRLGTAPDNNFTQVNASGGYNYSSTTKLVMSAALGQSKQDQAFLPADISNSSQYTLPRNSLGGEVDITTVTAKLTMKPIDKLNVALNLKYDDHHNKTPVSTYNMPDMEGDVGSLDTRSNTPFSKRTHQVTLDGDYLLGRGKWLKAGFDRQSINRWCDGTWYACSDTGKTAENTYKLEFRTSMTDSLNGRIGYAYSRRTADAYNPDANILASLPQSGALSTLVGQVASLGTTLWGPMSGAVVAGTGSSAAAATAAAKAAYPASSAAYQFGGLSSAVNVGGTYYVYLLDSAIGKSTVTGGVAPWIPGGMERYNLADRNRNKIRSSLNWNASDAISVQAAIDYNKDEYTNTTDGLQHGSTAGYNLDASYAASEDFTTDVFLTYEDQKQYSTGYPTSSNSVSTAASAQVAGTVYVMGSPSTACSYNTILAKNLNAKVDPCLNWSADIHDTAQTVGAAFKYRNLMKKKLDLAGNVIYSYAKTTQSFGGGAYTTPIGINPATNSAWTSNTAAVYYYGTPTPDVVTETWTLNVSGQYALDKRSWLKLSYLFEHMKVSDYAYNGVAVGSMQTVLPTMETAPAFSVNVVGVSYLRQF